jgi:hypothetical protein
MSYLQNIIELLKLLLLECLLSSVCSCTSSVTLGPERGEVRLIYHMSLLQCRISAGNMTKEVRKKHCQLCVFITNNVMGNQSLASTVSVHQSPPPRGRLYLGPKVWHRMCREPLCLISEVAPILTYPEIVYNPLFETESASLTWIGRPFQKNGAL